MNVLRMSSNYSATVSFRDVANNVAYADFLSDNVPLIIYPHDHVPRFASLRSLCNTLPRKRLPFHMLINSKKTTNLVRSFFHGKFLQSLLEMLCRTDLSHDGMAVSFWKTLETTRVRWKSDRARADEVRQAYVYWKDQCFGVFMGALSRQRLLFQKPMN